MLGAMKNTKTQNLTIVNPNGKTEHFYSSLPPGAAELVLQQDPTVSTERQRPFPVIPERGPVGNGWTSALSERFHALTLPWFYYNLAKQNQNGKQQLFCHWPRVTETLTMSWEQLLATDGLTAPVTSSSFTAMCFAKWPLPGSWSRFVNRGHHCTYGQSSIFQQLKFIWKEKILHCTKASESNSYVKGKED